MNPHRTLMHRKGVTIPVWSSRPGALVAVSRYVQTRTGIVMLSRYNFYLVQNGAILNHAWLTLEAERPTLRAEAVRAASEWEKAAGTWWSALVTGAVIDDIEVAQEAMAEIVRALKGVLPNA